LIIVSNIIVACRAQKSDHRFKKILLDEKFTEPLSPEWSWGMGTWISQKGVLRCYESGERRHGPMKNRMLNFQNATIDVDFKLERKANGICINFDGCKGRSRLLMVCAATDSVKLVVFPNKGQLEYAYADALFLDKDTWHHLSIKVNGKEVTARLEGKQFSATADCINEEKCALGLEADTGGPEGESAGAVEFRKLVVGKLE
jgi:hypothetical protein